MPPLPCLPRRSPCCMGPITGAASSRGTQRAHLQDLSERSCPATRNHSLILPTLYIYNQAFLMPLTPALLPVQSVPRPMAVLSEMC